MDQIIEDYIQWKELATYPEGMPLHNKQTLRSQLNRMCDHAKPGSPLWYWLEHEVGEVGDYDASIDIDRVTN